MNPAHIYLVTRMAELTTLKPVVLANDDFNDEDQTFCKQTFSQFSEFECGQRYTSVQHITVSPLKETFISEETALKQYCAPITVRAEGHSPEDSVNVSSRQLIHVTSANVDEIYSEIEQPIAEQLSCSDDLIQLNRDLPKDMFVNRLLSDYHSDEMQLKNIRSKLFDELKALEEFPFASGNELKRRKKTKIGESVAMKLCYDIHTLTSVLDGAPFEEVKDMISSGKYSTANDSVCFDHASQSPNPANSTCNNPDLALLQTIVSKVQADILTLRQDNNGLREEIGLIKKDIKVIKSDIAQHTELMAKSTADIRQSVERVTDTSQNGVASVKSDIKQMRIDLSSTNDHLNTHYEQLKETISLIQKVEKRVNKVDSKIQKLHNNKLLSDDTCASISRAGNSGPSSAESVINLESEDENIGTLNTSTHCTNEAVDTDVVSNSETYLHRSPSTGRLHRVPRKTNKNTHTTTSDTLFSADRDLIHIFTPGNQESVQTQKCSSASSSNKIEVLTTQKSTENSRENTGDIQYTCPVAYRYNVLDNKSVSYSDILQKNNSTTRQTEQSSIKQTDSIIPVIISGQQTRNNRTRMDPPVNRVDTLINVDDDDNDDDDDFETYIRRRSQRFYVGGFQANVTEKIISRGITARWVSIRRYPSQNRAVIRLNVDADVGYQLLDEGFWPRGVTCRHWYSNNQYRRNVTSHDHRRGRSSGDESYYNDNDRYGNRYIHGDY